MESAVTLTKALRWDIQQLGTRLEKAAGAEEMSRKKSTRSKTKAVHDAEIRNIVKDIRALLARIEDAVPLINLAISTSGASLSATLPNTVSPSRLMQASTLLTYGDWQYSTNPTSASQIGPTLTLTLYMLFAGHVPTDHGDPNEKSKNTRPRKRNEERDMKWKEVIHKAQIRLLRTPLTTSMPTLNSAKCEGRRPSTLSDEDLANDYAYQIQIIEDLDDDRVHSFDDDELQPGPYEGISLAGIREVIPIHQISKIFYADTGKILNIGNPGEANSPVLLLKRDIQAPLPNRMMENDETTDDLYGDLDELTIPDDEGNDSQENIDQQIRRESIAIQHELNGHGNEESHAWRFPPDLDPEWFALEVYTEADDFSDDEDEDEPEHSSPSANHSGSKPQSPSEDKLTSSIGKLSVADTPSPAPTRHNKAIPTPKRPQFSPSPSPFTGDFSNRYDSREGTPTASAPTTSTPFGHIRSSLSLLEMLIRLTALQQFQQVSHLTIPDQLLVFFLSESSSTGGSDSDGRRQTRYEARRKVGFDPYDESPVKLHGEDYQYQHQESYPSPSQARMGFRDHDERSPQYEDENSRTSLSWLPPTFDGQRADTPGPWLQRNNNLPSPLPRIGTPDSLSPYRPARKSTRPLQRVRQEGRREKGSPLGRGMSVETDSTLGTSPGTPAIRGAEELG